MGGPPGCPCPGPMGGLPGCPCPGPMGGLPGRTGQGPPGLAGGLAGPPQLQRIRPPLMRQPQGLSLKDNAIDILLFGLVLL